MKNFSFVLGSSATLSRLECPKFDGDDFRGWWTKLEQYFETEGILEGSKVRMAMLNLEGRALESFGDPMRELINLKQHSSIFSLKPNNVGVVAITFHYGALNTSIGATATVSSRTRCLDTRKFMYQKGATLGASLGNGQIENWADSSLADNSQLTDTSTNVDNDHKNQLHGVQHGAVMNQEATRKSRLRKKTYVQQLESSRLRLTELEQEFQRAQQLAVNSHMGDNELYILVGGVMVHDDEVFKLKSIGAKEDVFHMLSANMREIIFIMIYVSFDMILGAYLIGNMTALIVKGSKIEKFRDKMADVIKVNCAAYNGDFYQLKSLIRAGADPNKIDYDGRSPLHLVVLLIKEGASLNIDDAGSYLCTAVAKGDSYFLRRLLSNGVDPNSKDYDHRTPLQVAASEGLYIMVKLFIEAGASVFSKDRSGNTPLDEAQMCGNKNLIKLLEDATWEPLSVIQSKFPHLHP
ncbi:hypothetical protein Gotri_016094 [Gossypium trilobum]|uniref:DOG1 domain-containing protein n=1 Tax=Gossypium trilobum TaxID=34281 RepID=A0A7J9E2S4_9ROSI|nr:hypothetical protein [Gossypium trilobum]